MKTPLLLAAAIAALPLAAAAAPEHAAKPAQASIPFVNHGGIRDWRADGTETLYVQDRGRNWYRAELLGPCLDLPFAQTIGFETRGVDRFDRFSIVRVRGERCAVTSLVKSDPPPPKRARRAS